MGQGLGWWLGCWVVVRFCGWVVVGGAEDQRIRKGDVRTVEGKVESSLKPRDGQWTMALQPRLLRNGAV